MYNKNMKNKGFRWVFFGACLVFSVLFNLAAWMSTAFSDFYTNNIFPHLTEGYGRFTSLFPFSVGEILLVILVLLAAGFVLFLLVLLLSLIFREKEKNSSYLWLFKIKKVLSRFYLSVFTVLFPLVAVIMSLNCFVLYHCSPLTAAEKSSDHDVKELEILRDYVVTKCNELSLTVKRDDEGNVVYEGDMAKKAGEAMLGIYDGKNRLDGFYVTPKALTFSGFMSQQNMQGYYFPFSMEAN